MAEENNKNLYPYSTFVSDDNDLKGIIAYSLYKRSKIEYREKLDKDSSLSETKYKQKLEEWKMSKLLPGEVLRINEAAEQYLEEYVEHYKDSHFPWFRSILASIAATALVTIFTIALSVGIAIHNKFNPMEMIETATKNAVTSLASQAKGDTNETQTCP